MKLGTVMSAAWRQEEQRRLPQQAVEEEEKLDEAFDYGLLDGLRIALEGTLSSAFGKDWRDLEVDV